MLKISVIITVYNIEKYLKECIESIIHQSYHNLEIILVDDGSTDLSGEICDTYASFDQRIKVIHQNNQGVMKAWYNGVLISTGEYISNVDGDDWIKENMYSSLMEILEHYNVDIIGFGGYRYFSSKNVKECNDFVKAGVYQKEEMITDIFPNMIWDSQKELLGGLDPSRCMKLIRKDLLLDFLNRECDLNRLFQISYGEDIVTVYPLIYKAKSIYITHEHYYFHRQRKNGEVAGYIKDNDYTKKLFIIYDMLVDILSGIPNIIKQLDMMVSRSMDIKERYYYPNNITGRKLHLFPFEQVERNKCIVLYGAGNVGKEYYEQLSKIDYCKLVAWVDKNHENYDDRITAIDEIYYKEFDYIVIAIESNEVCVAVRNQLLQKGVADKKIVWGRNHYDTSE